MNMVKITYAKIIAYFCEICHNITGAYL